LLEAAEKETCNAADGSVSDVGTSLKAKKGQKRPVLLNIVQQLKGLFAFQILGFASNSIKL
jgi:hypothetical protein